MARFVKLDSVYAVLLLVLTGLASPMLSGDGLASIVLMYSAKDTHGLGGYFEVSIDGRRVAKLRYPTYVRLAVPPGAYTVTMDAPSRSPVLCHVIAGESCYVRARMIGNENRREFDLVSPEEAFRQLRNTIPLEKEKVYLQAWK
jgi:hypothetical protein